MHDWFSPCALMCLVPGGPSCRAFNLAKIQSFPWLIREMLLQEAYHKRTHGIQKDAEGFMYLVIHNYNSIGIDGLIQIMYLGCRSCFRHCNAVSGRPSWRSVPCTCFKSSPSGKQFFQKDANTRQKGLLASLPTILMCRNILPRSPLCQLSIARCTWSINGSLASIPSLSFTTRSL